MRIGIDAFMATPRAGGIGTYTLNLIRTLVELGRDEIVVFMPATHKSHFLGVVKTASLQVITANYDEPRRTEHWDQVIIPQLLVDHKVDVFLGPSFIIPLECNCPTVVTVHDRFFELSNSGGADGYFLRWARVCAQKADSIICVSEYTSGDIQKHWNLDRTQITTVYLAPSLDFIPSSREVSRHVVSEAFTINSPYVLHVGGWHPRKNLIQVIDAFSKLDCNVTSNLRLLATAEPNGLSRSLLQRLKLNDKVIFTGYVDPLLMPYLYSAAEALVYPSSSEGFGLPPVEAIACGTAVITSPVGAIPEVIGENAIFVNQDDINEIRLAIERIITDKNYKFQTIETCKSRVGEFSWMKTAMQTRNVLEQALEGRSSNRDYARP